MLPMFTESVSKQDIAAFERFIGAQVISSEVLPCDTVRSQYFACGRSAQNLFIDPTTGLRMERTGRAKASNCLFASELTELALCRPNALSVVFDQSFAHATEPSRILHLENKLRSLAEQGVQAFAY